MMAGFGIDTSGQVVLQQSTESGAAPALTLGGSMGAQTPSAGQAPQTSQGQIAEISAAVEQRRQHDTGAATMEAINKLSRGVLDPYVQAMQNEAYYNGAAQVVQGKTLMEVQEQQPWMTRIFGPSASVRGAQAMTVMKSLADAQTGFMTDMPKLRTQSTDDVRRYLVQQATRVNVGDPQMDNLIRSKMMENWQPMLELHAKENYKFVQEQNVNAFGQWHLSEGDALQATLKSGGNELSPETTKMMRERVLGGIERPAGMDETSYKKAIASSAQANLARGNFAWFRIFKGSQQFTSMDAADQTKMLDLQLRYENQWKNKAAANEDIGIRSSVMLAKANAGLLSPNEVIAAARDFNNEWYATTGSESPFFTMQDLGSAIKGNVGAILKAQERQDAKLEKLSDEGKKAAAKDAQLAHIYRTFRAGQGSLAWQVPDGDKNLADGQFAMMYRNDAAGDPNKANELLVKNYQNAEYVNPLVSNQMLAGVRATADGYTDAFQSSYSAYAALRAAPGGVTTAAAYFGDYARQMAVYHDQVQSGVPAAEAWNTAFTKTPDIQAGIDRAGGRKQFADAVNGAIDDKFGGFFATKLSDYARNLVYDNIANRTSANTIGTGFGIKEATEMAIAQSRVDKMDSDAYIRREGQLPVAQALNIPNDAMGKTWAHVRDTQLSAQGVDKSAIRSMQRLPGNDVAIAITYLDRKGVHRSLMITGEQLNSQYKADFPLKGENLNKGPNKSNSLKARAGTQPMAKTMAVPADGGYTPEE
ncbi:internal virion protein [Ralstonia phage RSJ2]|uniref:Putative internal virion protein n=1 Tax=Ralstonia phage RSJ2 TaxID=1481785 RepID=A0A068Q5S1_9CAUD|nr:internal virion protein [Ralstonia phage RSJ2]BAP15841.1 putative internal virion protein [Ralstonia phage RSJ2]